MGLPQQVTVWSARRAHAASSPPATCSVQGGNGNLRPMRIRTVALMAFLVSPALGLPGRARACKPATPPLHTVDPAQVGVDQTPPQLMEPTLAELQTIDHGCGGKCGWDHSARIIYLATDDMTPVDRIGYRVTVVSGAAPNLTTGGGKAILGAADGSLTLFWDGDDDFDFTLQLIAVDAA